MQALERKLRRLLCKKDKNTVILVQTGKVKNITVQPSIQSKFDGAPVKNFASGAQFLFKITESKSGEPEVEWLSQKLDHVVNKWERANELNEDNLPSYKNGTKNGDKTNSSEASHLGVDLEEYKNLPSKKKRCSLPP